MTHPDNMKHLAQLQAVADSDVAVIRKKESTYQGSWKAAGGRSAWFMFRRNMDRLLKMMQPPHGDIHFSLPDLDDAIEQAGKGNGDCTLDFSVVQYLRDAYVAEDIFAQIELQPSGADGTVFAVLRDMRRYALLIEAEMVAQGVAQTEMEMETESPWVPNQELIDDLQPRSETSVMIPPGGTYRFPFGETLSNIGDHNIWIDPNSLRLHFTTLPIGTQTALDMDRAEGFLRSALERVLGLDGVDIYMFVARLGGIPRDAAKRKVLQVLFGVDSEEELGRDLAYLKARLPGGLSPSEMQEPEPTQAELRRNAAAMDERPGTPADGGYHEALAPWSVSRAWLGEHQALTLKHVQGGSVYDWWWKLQGQDHFVLEAAVSGDTGTVPSIIAHLYDTVGTFRVVRITSCPPGAREWFPGLRREVNSMELDGLPEWQRGMYRWHNSTTKWIIEAQYEAWVQD